MAFMDKVEMFANMAVEKTGDLYETGRAKGKIVLIQGKMKDAQLELGKYVWDAHVNQQAINADILDEHFAKIQGFIDEIKAVEHEAEMARKENK